MHPNTEYYFTDLFTAVVNNNTSRGHPILAALLYAFCPMAAKWWLNGAIPVVPYDPVWEATADFSSDPEKRIPDIDLKQALAKREIPDLAGHVRKYKNTVKAFRNSYAAYISPELWDFFKGDTIEVTARTGYQASFDKYFGGDWRNVLKYARAWIFTIQDWRGNVGIEQGGDYKFYRVELAFNVPRLNRNSINWPAWYWEINNGVANRIVVGMMVNNGIQDQLQFALAAHSGRPGNVPWKVVPQLYALDRLSGRAEPTNGYLDPEKTIRKVTELAVLAEKGGCAPLAAINQPYKCEHCGFRALCFTKENSGSQILFESISQDSEKLGRSFI